VEVQMYFLEKMMVRHKKEPENPHNLKNQLLRF
jgi:hypothetical protein